MSRFPAEIVPVLGDAVDAARTALRRLEADEVPVSMRKVVASAGGRLAPPIARSLLDELDTNDWLRDKTLAEVGDGASEASSAFLLRPDGWWRVVAAAVAAAAEASATSGVASSERRTSELEARLGGANDRIEALRLQLSESQATIDSRLADARNAIKELRQSEGEEVRRVELELNDLRSRFAQEQDARIEVERLVADLRARLKRQRRNRASDAREGNVKARSFHSEAVEMAKTLDAMAEAVRRVGAEPPPTAPQGRVGITLPAGVRPDEPAAVEWLLTMSSPFTLIVDGYNLAFHLDSKDFAAGRARTRVIQDLGRLARQAHSSVRVDLVFDSAVTGERESEQVAGINVHFAEADRLADDEVLHLAHVASGAVVVVSSDREVRDGAEEAGALVLWSEAVAAWIQA